MIFIFFVIIYSILIWNCLLWVELKKIKCNFEINECKYLLYINKICKIYIIYLINEYVVGYIILIKKW